MKKQSNLSRLMGYAGGYRFLTYASWVLSAGSALLSLVPFWYIWRVIKAVLESAPNYGEAVHAAHYGWMAVLFAVLSMLVYIGALMCSHLSAFHIATNIRMGLTHHIAKLPLGKIEQFGTGKLRRVISETSGAAETYLAHQLPDQYKTYATVLGLLVLLFTFDWRLGLLSLVPVALAFAIMATMTGRRMQDRMTQYQNALADMSNEAVEYVRGISVIKVFGQSVHSIRRFKEAINAYRDDALAFTMACKPGYVGFNTVVNAAFLVLIPAALIGMTSAGDLTAFIENFLFYLIFAPACASVLNKIMYMSNYKMQAMESMRRIDTILLAREQSEAQEPQMAQGSDICFEHVTFTYPTGEQPAVSDVSFTAKAGTVTALVGHSGSGKTTIGTLVPRFYDVQEGRITLGGVELSEISRQEVMGKIAFVFQNPKLLKTTLEENIRGGCKNASREDILRAARLAQCDDILAKLPEGIDSIVGGKGVYLSGGEVQRVAIARAILKDAPVIILDEVTAFADPENEVQIQAALKELTKGKTVIMIAHRLSTIQDADQILVMKAGRLVEQGTHQELLGKNGEYAHMWADYNQAIAWKIDRKEEVKPC